MFLCTYEGPRATLAEDKSLLFVVLVLLGSVA